MVQFADYCKGRQGKPSHSAIFPGLVVYILDHFAIYRAPTSPFGPSPLERASADPLFYILGCTRCETESEGIVFCAPQMWAKL